MRFVQWIVIESSYDKNYSGVAKKTPRGLLASVVPGMNYQISLLDSNATLSIRIHHLFCGVEELSVVIPIIPKPGFSISPATCWVALLRFNGVWTWIYHHLWEDGKWASITNSFSSFVTCMYNLYEETAKAAEVGDGWENILAPTDIRVADQGGNMLSVLKPIPATKRMFSFPMWCSIKTMQIHSTISLQLPKRSRKISSDLWGRRKTWIQIKFTHTQKVQDS